MCRLDAHVPDTKKKSNEKKIFEKNSNRSGQNHVIIMLLKKLRIRMRRAPVLRC